MDTRRSFLKKTALLSGAIGVAQFLPPSIQRALAIDPARGSTYLDAEHIVLLMQENRSFDHTFGTLRGVRGFNDPRAIWLADKNKVWLQTNKNGETFSPFRLDIKDTKITWMGSLPHGRESQMAARNNGKHDNWIEAKKSGEKAYENMPLTMGYYTREDIPFYYALADAFTICDQNFCSSLTGTDPNRLYFWSGSAREKGDENTRAYLQNEDVETGVEWETFPERLEQNDISWKVYQNEISQDNGLTDEQDAWLGNFGDNVLQYFNQYNVNLTKNYIAYLPKKIAVLQNEINELQIKIQSLSQATKEYEDAEKSLNKKQSALNSAKDDQQKCTIAEYEKLNDFQKNIHQKAFSVNDKDPFQHELESLNYDDGNIERKINIPKGDVLHQFRKDVETGDLPTVSWLVAPENFSDHPSAPWFGSWYLSEAMDILTKDPEVWKKTIFILAYDENDGYFDHVPPFVAPDPLNPAAGKASEGIDTSIEFTGLEKDSPGSIGLGYRVPLIIASPWSRGGWVNSQVFDHTSSLQFLEDFLNKKFGKKIEEKNISQWRRTICGDLSSAFQPYNGEKISALPFLEKKELIENIHKAKFKNVPNNYKQLVKEDIDIINHEAQSSPFMPRQEKGIRPSCALPYELYVDGKLGDDKKSFAIKMKAGNEIFGSISAGAPFSIYTTEKYLNEDMKLFSYGVSAGNTLTDKWNINDFENNKYHFRVYGPNGFYREFVGDANDPAVNILCNYQRNLNNPKKLTGNIELKINNRDNLNSLTVEIKDNAYKRGTIKKNIAANTEEKILLDLGKSYGWYDLTVKANGNDFFEKRYAGHIETGSTSFSDPVMGR